MGNNKTSTDNSNLINAILQNVKSLVLVADISGSIVYCSPSVAELLNVSEAEVLGAGWWELTIIEKAERLKEISKTVQLITGEKPLRSAPYAKSISLHNGSELWIQWQDSPGPNGTLIKIGQNITEQYLAQKDFELQYRRYKRLSIVAEKTDNNILILDRNGNVEWISESFQRLNNTTLEQLIAERGKNIREISNNPDIERILDKVVNEKLSLKYESKNKHVNGEMWEFSTISPVLNDKDEVTNIIIIDSDVTEKKILERELNLLSIVASKTDNAVVIANAEGVIEWVNEGLQKMHSKNVRTPKSIIGQSLVALSSNKDLAGIIENSRKHKTSFIYESESTNEEGREYWVQSTLTPILDAQGEVCRFVIIDADITSRKAAEDVIAQKNKDLTDSLNYALRIQNAILPDHKKIFSLLPDTFVLFQPRDIVSGDFYFVESIRLNDGTVLTGFAVGDCTGHGVPGALMSMMATSFLKHSLTEKDVNSPADALEYLNQKISLMLHQHSDSDEIRDGLDLAFCVLNTRTHMLYFSGAHRPIVFVQGGEIHEIRGINRSIGHSATSEAFTNHAIQLQNGDCVYLFSDGYSDQFGGPQGKKFKHARFKQIIAENHALSMQDQLNILKEAHAAWKGELEQVDDICILGVRI